MTTRVVLRRAPIRVPLTHFYCVFLGIPVMYVLQMTMIQIIHVVPMLNSGVTATWAVGVRTCAARLIGAGHCDAFPFWRLSCVAV